MADATLERARAGDSDAFAELTDPYRRQLHMHCYRILGSFQDAEDVLQETMLSAWQAIDRFDGRALRAWLYRIATNRCLNYLRDASRRPSTVATGTAPALLNETTPSDEPWWLEPYPDVLIDPAAPGPEARYDARESIALSFVAGLQRLPTQQRSALVLRDVLGFSAAETAEMLGSTPASVNSALQRARNDFKDSPDTELVPLPRSKEESAVAESFADAYEQGDIDRIVAILTDDCRATMPPEPLEVLGPTRIGSFLVSLGFWGRPVKVVHTRANGQPAFGYYIYDDTSSLFRAGGLIVLALRGDRISQFTRFPGTAVFGMFGLPRTICAEDCGPEA
ncbi:MAG TPA: RNA polymerase subunit sigma-70 [Acidimicrobiales bacterium]|jgi:RNA polymerase sigma-70 factor (ECF subfamily)|nr:RNA polymerase subunit sigma-70 [Acidimicrobiales bacterium]